MARDELPHPQPGPGVAPTELGQTAGARPPGELGGHTVQPWEQDAVPPTTTPNSKDVPPPEMGTKEAASTGPGATGRSAKTTAAPGNQPSGTSPGHGRSVGRPPAAAQGQVADLPGSEGTGPVAARDTPATAASTKGQQGPPSEAVDVDLEELPPSLTRPSRPPVYRPQNGHEPAPRPTPAQAALAKAKGPATEGDALVDAIVKAIAENLAKAFQQSVAQAVRDSMPLSGRSVAQPKVDVGPNLTKAPPKPKPAKADKASKPVPPAKPDATPPPPKEEAAAKPAEGGVPDPSAQGNYGAGVPKRSQYGGTIEAPDDEAKAKLAKAGNPANPAIGQPAQESADRESREGKLA